MKFLNKEDYENQRQALLDRAQELIDKGEIEEANNVMKNEIPELENAYKDYADAQANFNALNNKAPSAVQFNGGFNALESADMHDTIEYRRAFKDFVLTGKSIPGMLNSDAVTKTSDVSAVIPTTVLEKIVEKMENIGMILPLITQTAYKGGVTVPTSTAKPVATWVAEGSGSDKQKKTTGSIVFGAYKLRCAVSMTIETETMALPIFESTFIKNVAEAMTKALEQAIVDGSGSGQPKGILKETPVEGQTVELTEGAGITFDDIVAMDSALPSAYEAGTYWFMTKKTFNKIKSIKDDNKNPIFTEVVGTNGKPQRMIYGYPVILNDYMPSYSESVTADTTIAFLFRPADYILNTNMQMTMKRYEDNNTDDMVTKAIMLADGKVVDKNSLVTLTIKNS